MHKNS